MVFNWKDFLDIADSFSQNNLGEAYNRTGISRAYYAAYNIAKNYATKEHLLKKQDVSGKPLKSHEGVWMGLKSSQNTQIRLAGISGASLKATRVDADYNSEAFVSSSRLEDACSQAKTIIELIENN